MFYSNAELLRHYQTVEAEKGEGFDGYSKELILARCAATGSLCEEQLQQLQLCIEPKIIRGKIHPTFEIFKLIGSTKAGQIAEAMNYIRRKGSISLKNWLQNIDKKLEKRIHEGECPAIIVSPVLLVHRGNIPDGNHRVLAALQLALKGEAVRLSTYEIASSSAVLMALNAVVFCDRLKSNPIGTTSLLKQRLKDMY